MLVPAEDESKFRVLEEGEKTNQSLFKQRSNLVQILVSRNTTVQIFM